MAAASGSVLKHCLWFLVAQATTPATATAATMRADAARAGAVSPGGAYNFSQAAIDNGEALSQLSADALRAARALNAGSSASLNSTCSADRVQVRKEWRKLSVDDRKSFVAAVQCLQASPSLLDPVEIPAAKSAFDDFVLVHANQTSRIHLTANFLLWHRFFTWTYEQKLRSVCGYKGIFPYWDWSLDVTDPAASPVFDGSETSMGSNGAPIPHEGLQLVQSFTNTTVQLPPGSGGGCVTSGPFANMTVHAGPRLLWQYGSPTFTATDTPAADHPRCLKRDLNKGIAQRYTSFRNVTSLVLKNDGIEWFQAVMQGDDRYVPGTELGAHGGGHYTIGGDPGSDPFISPGEPAFYLHHAQVDRVYWIWQMLDFANRQEVFGTETLQNNPPSRNVTVDGTVDISPLGGPVKLIDLMSTVGGSPLCYVYE